MAPGSYRRVHPTATRWVPIGEGDLGTRDCGSGAGFAGTG